MGDFTETIFVNIIYHNLKIDFKAWSWSQPQ